jgi:hypothetical protein
VRSSEVPAVTPTSVLLESLLDIGVRFSEVFRKEPYSEFCGDALKRLLLEEHDEMPA